MKANAIAKNPHADPSVCCCTEAFIKVGSMSRIPENNRVIIRKMPQNLIIFINKSKLWSWLIITILSKSKNILPMLSWLHRYIERPTMDRLRIELQTKI